MMRDRLHLLGQLAALRAQRSAAALARRMTILTELEARDAALRNATPQDTADLTHLIARDRHDTWRGQQLAKLSLDLARANAQVQPYREAHSRDLAREQVIARLRSRRAINGQIKALVGQPF